MTDHIDRLMAVMDAAFDPFFQEAWTRRQVEDALVTGMCRYCLISENGKPSTARDTDDNENTGGFYLSRQVVSDTELLLLAVDPVFRGRGLGTLLLEHLIGAARSNGSDRIFLEMRRDNPAEQLYRNLGFAPVGKRPNYYRMLNGTRVDAITFAISI